MYYIYTVKYSLKIYLQIVWKIRSYFSYFSESVLCRQVYAVTPDWTQGYVRPMAQFPSYFCIASRVINSTTSRFICSKLYIFLLSLQWGAHVVKLPNPLWSASIYYLQLWKHSLLSFEHTAPPIGREKIKSVSPNQRLTACGSLFVFRSVWAPCWYSQTSFESDSKTKLCKARTPGRRKLERVSPLWGEPRALGVGALPGELPVAPLPAQQPAPQPRREAAPWPKRCLQGRTAAALHSFEYNWYSLKAGTHRRHPQASPARRCPATFVGKRAVGFPVGTSLYHVLQSRRNLEGDSLPGAGNARTQSPSSFAGTEGAPSSQQPTGELRPILFSETSARFSPKVGSQPVLRSLPPHRNGFSLHTQAQSTWLCSLLISNLGFPSSSSPPLSPGISGGQAAAAGQRCAQEAGQGSNILERLLFLSAFCSNAGVQRTAACVRDYSSCFYNPIQIGLKSLRKKSLPASSNSKCFSVQCLCVSFP